MTKYYKTTIYKRFVVFEFADYYPTGGMGDCEESFDTLEEAEEYMKEVLDDGIVDNLDLFDMSVGKFVQSEYER